MGKFAKYLLDGPAIGFSASTTYLSSVKEQLVTSTNTHFFSVNKSWYRRLRYTLRAGYTKNAAKEGKPLQRKAPIMIVEDLQTISRILFTSNGASAMKDRTLVAFLWSLLGRSSDIGDLAYEYF